jgi:hypothetical protein
VPGWVGVVCERQGHFYFSVSSSWHAFPPTPAMAGMFSLFRSQHRCYLHNAAFSNHWGLKLTCGTSLGNNHLLTLLSSGKPMSCPYLLLLKAFLPSKITLHVCIRPYSHLILTENSSGQGFCLLRWLLSPDPLAQKLTNSRWPINITSVCLTLTKTGVRQHRVSTELSRSRPWGKDQRVCGSKMGHIYSSSPISYNGAGKNPT